MGAVAATVSDFSDWFRGEFGALRRAVKINRTVLADLRLEIGGNGSSLPIAVFHDREEKSEVAASVEELGDTIDTVIGRRCSSTQIDFCEGSFVARQLAPYRLPKSRQEQMAAMDVSASTPFSPQSVYLLFPDDLNDSKTAQYFIVKKDQIASIIDLLKMRGLKLEEVVFRIDGGSVCTGKPGSKMLAGSRWQDSLSRWISLACLVLAIVGLTSLYAMADRKLDTALDMLNSEISDAQNAADIARNSYQRQSALHAKQAALRQEKTAARATVTIWEELSRIIPDNTWLADMSVKDGTITLSGFSTSATDIIPLLESSGKFKNPRFIASVNRVPGRNFEKFTLQMQVRSSEAES